MHRPYMRSGVVGFTIHCKYGELVGARAMLIMRGSRIRVFQARVVVRPGSALVRLDVTCVESSRAFMVGCRGTCPSQVS